MKKRISILLVVAMLINIVCSFSIVSAEGEPSILIYGGPNFDVEAREDVVYFKDGVLGYNELSATDAEKTLVLHLATKNIGEIGDFGVVLKYDAKQLVPAVLFSGAMCEADPEYDTSICVSPTLYTYLDGRATKSYGNEPAIASDKIGESVSVVGNAWTTPKDGYGYISYNFNTGAATYAGKDTTKYYNFATIPFLYADGVTAADLTDDALVICDAAEGVASGLFSDYATNGGMWISDKTTSKIYNSANGLVVEKDFAPKAAEPTAEPTPAPTAEPTPAPTAEPTPAPTAEPTPAPTAEPTPAPTAEPTPAPTEAPTAEPTPAPTEAPTAEPTPAPTEAPTAEPTPAPTEAPTAEPTVEPSSEVRLNPNDLFFLSGIANVEEAEAVEGYNTAYKAEALDGYAKHVIGGRVLDQNAKIESAVLDELVAPDQITEWIDSWAVGIDRIAANDIKYVVYKVTATDGVTVAYYVIEIENIGHDDATIREMWTSGFDIESLDKALADAADIDACEGENLKIKSLTWNPFVAQAIRNDLGDNTEDGIKGASVKYFIGETFAEAEEMTPAKYFALVLTRGTDFDIDERLFVEVTAQNGTTTNFYVFNFVK